MVKLSNEHLIYLLYASAYVEEGTVTKGDTKSCLPTKWRRKADEIYNHLHGQGLIEQVKRGRFSVTEKGTKVLSENLALTDYRFDSVKGPKVLNALLACMKTLSEESHTSSDEMTFEEFEHILKNLYLEKKRQQELKGVVAIHSKSLCDDFLDKYALSPEKLKKYFDKLKETGKIFAVDEKGNELIQWVE